MRIALLSAVESRDGASFVPRAEARIAGKCVLQHQMEFAIAHGCEKIACLTRGLPDDIAVLQKVADDADVQLRCVRDFLSLTGWINAGDDILVIQDGLLFTPDIAGSLELQTRSILTLPANDCVDAGFERLDREKCWAGVMFLPGFLAEKMHDVPDDFDVHSSLLRLALHARVPCQPIEAETVGEGRWALLSDDVRVQRLSEQWMAALSSTYGPASPVLWLAETGAKWLLRRNREPMRATYVFWAFSALFVVLAGASIHFGQQPLGFFAVTAAVFGFAFAFRLKALISSEYSTGANSAFSVKAVWNGAGDAMLIALVASFVVPLKLAGALFAILSLIGLIRTLGPVSGADRPQLFDAAMTDRGLVSLILGIAALFDLLIPVIQGLVLLVIAFGMVRHYRSRIT